MHSLAILLLIIAAISTLSIAAIRLLFKIKIDNLSEELKYITPYNSAEHCIHNPGLQFIDIETEINNIFKGHTIYHSEEINFTEHYTPIFNKNLKSASNLNGNLNCSKELEHYAS